MPGAQPHAHAYCGHQFGSFAGQLGDGAAMYLGEVEGPSGRWVDRFCGAIFRVYWYIQYCLDGDAHAVEFGVYRIECMCP